MAISQNSKSELKDKIEKLKGQKQVLTGKIQELKERHDHFVAAKATVQAQIDALQNDVDTN